MIEARIGILDSGETGRNPCPGEVAPEEVVRRLWRAADRQIAESERRMSALADGELEREARTLSVIGKLVRDLSEIAAVGRRAEGEGRQEHHYGDAVDLDRFRAELASRVERLREEQAAAAAPGTVHAG